jgi:hypothetical protein
MSDEFEIDTDNPENLQDVPTEIIVSLALSIIQELELRVNRKEKLRVVN